MSTKKTKPKKASRRSRRTKYVAVLIVVLTASLSFGAVFSRWRNLPVIRNLVSPAPRVVQPASPPTIPPPTNPSKEYIYGGGKLIATESGKSDQTITFNSISDRTYGDASFSISGTASSGLAVSFTVISGPAAVSGSMVTLTGAGAVSITAAQAGNDGYNPAQAVTRSFNCAKATATVTLTNLTQTYDGAAHYASVATSPANLNVGLGYDQGGTNVSSPTNAGSYSASATVNDSNYQGNAAGTLIINKATATLSINSSSLNQTYDGIAKPVTSTTSPAGLSTVSITYDGGGTSPSNAGSYAVVATLANSNYQSSAANGTLIIAKAAQTVTFNALSDKTYGDAPFTISGSSSSGLSVSFSVVSGPATVSGSTVTINGAGTVTVRASQSGNSNVSAATDVDRNFNVAKGSATITLSNLTQTYDGTPRAATATTNPSGLSGVAITYNGSTTAPTNAGSYSVVASLTNSNYTASNATGTLVISTTTATIILSNLNQTCDGSPKSATATTNPAGLTVISITYNGSAAVPTNAGSYAVVASLTNATYSASNATGTLVIAKATPTVAWNNPADIVYGTALSSTQLNATSSFGGNSVQGTFAYLPAIGTVLNTGNNQTLSTTFAPTDSTNYNNATGTAHINVAAAGNTPYTGSPASIPGVLESELYDNGGEGSAYHDTSPGTHGQDYDQWPTLPPPTFRQPTDVDIYKAVNYYSNGYLVVMQAGDWMKYTVNIASAGSYALQARVAWGGTDGTLGTFHVECDGVDKTGSIQIPDTSWTLNNITKTGVQLPGGQHVLRLVADTNASNGVMGDVDYLSFTTENHSVSFDGSTGYVNVPISSSINITGALTVEAWFRVNNNNTPQVIASTNNGYGGYILIANQGMAQFYFTNASGVSDFAISWPPNITAGVWHHMAGVFDGSQIRVYLDGALCASQYTGISPGPGPELTIGSYRLAAWAPFNGLIDEVRISTGALYTSNFTPDKHLFATSTTKGLWKFDGQTLQDGSGNGNNGTFVGGASFSTNVP